VWGADHERRPEKRRAARTRTRRSGARRVRRTLVEEDPAAGGVLAWEGGGDGGRRRSRLRGGISPAVGNSVRRATKKWSGSMWARPPLDFFGLGNYYMAQAH
jgi:hypothetical protein